MKKNEGLNLGFEKKNVKDFLGLNRGYETTF